MEDPYAPIAPGTEGEVDFVDDIGTIHMKWDNGRALGIVPGEDSFSVLPPKLTTAASVWMTSVRMVLSARKAPVSTRMPPISFAKRQKPMPILSVV